MPPPSERHLHSMTWSTPFPIALLAALALAGAAVAEDAPVTSAGHKDMPATDATAAQIKQWVEGAPEIEDFAAAPPERDRRIHGEVSAWIGTNGVRGFSAATVIPIGKTSTLALAASRGQGPRGLGPQGLGYGCYADRAALGFEVDRCGRLIAP